MVRTRTFEGPILDIPEGTARCGHGQAPCGNAPPPPPHTPVSLEQLLDTQNDLMHLIVENEMCHMAEHQQPQHQYRDSSYSAILATHPPVFSDVTDPQEADNWLLMTESKFRILHYTEYQKTLYIAQQLQVSARARWAFYITALIVDHHTPWGKFHTAFHVHHLSVSLLHNKLKEFLDLEQGNHTVFYYTHSSTPMLNMGHITLIRMRTT
jgi:hypothetical protein